MYSWPLNGLDTADGGNMCKSEVEVKHYRPFGLWSSVPIFGYGYNLYIRFCYFLTFLPAFWGMLVLVTVAEHRFFYLRKSISRQDSQFPCADPFVMWWTKYKRYGIGTADAAMESSGARSPIIQNHPLVPTLSQGIRNNNSGVIPHVQSDSRYYFTEWSSRRTENGISWKRYWVAYSWVAMTWDDDETYAQDGDMDPTNTQVETNNGSNQPRPRRRWC
jgi:hypothetical protein